MKSPVSPQSVALGGKLRLQCSAEVSSGLGGVLSYTWHFVPAGPVAEVQHQHLQQRDGGVGGFVETGLDSSLEVEEVGWEHAVCRPAQIRREGGVL